MEREGRKMEKKGEERVRKSHVLVIPFPVQGHINPIFQFSKRLASKGLHVTFASAFANTQSLHSQSASVQIHSISDGLDQDGIIDLFSLNFQNTVSHRLEEIIVKSQASGCPIACVVYDSIMPWVLDLGKRLGVAGASFFTHSCAVSTVYYSAHEGLLRVPVEEPTVSIAGLPQLELCDLPSFVCDLESYPSFLSHILSRFSNFRQADWLFFNSIDSLEEEVVNWMASQWTIKTIGPNIPSMYLDKRLEDDKDYGLSLFKPNVEACTKWLDSKEIGSVLYVSFGSLASLGEAQMEELAWGLKRSNCYFLWVVRETEVNKLPRNLTEEISEKGLVVSWCNQLEVLAHDAVGCFLTHCGWNSTLEALSLGVPMVAMPQWADQMTNAKFVADVWKVGVKVKVGEKGIVSKEEIEVCIREVMERDRGKEIRNNSLRWKEYAKEAVDEGGSSDRNIDEFIAKLVGI